nr:MAG TPA: hypothetical protein [Caudoviricetes sp.]
MCPKTHQNNILHKNLPLSVKVNSASLSPFFLLIKKPTGNPAAVD